MNEEKKCATCAHFCEGHCLKFDELSQNNKSCFEYENLSEAAKRDEEILTARFHGEPSHSLYLMN